MSSVSFLASYDVQTLLVRVHIQVVFAITTKHVELNVLRACCHLE